jgi:transposase
MASEGTDPVSIARSLEVSERTVRYAVERFSSDGPEALRRRVSPGRPRSVSDSQSESLIGLIQRAPEEFGIPTQLWDIADLGVVAKSEGVLPDVSHWTVRREIARLINLHPKLRNRVSIPDQKQPGAPPGNRNAVRHGAYVSSGPSTEEHALVAGIEARFLRDFPGSGKDDTQLIRAVIEACLTLNRGLSADSADATMRADRRFRKAIKAVKAKKPRGGKPQTTPAEWAADLLRRFREG